MSRLASSAASRRVVASKSPKADVYVAMLAVALAALLLATLLLVLEWKRYEFKTTAQSAPRERPAIAWLAPAAEFTVSRG